MKTGEPDRSEAAASRGRDARRPRRGRWLVPIVIAGAAHLGAFTVLHVPVGRPMHQRLRRPHIEWVAPAVSAADSILSEQLALFDHAPLFLPTKWNFAGSPELTTLERSPADIFEFYEDRLHFPDEVGSRPLTFPELPGGPSALEVIDRIEWPYFEAFGQVDEPMNPLPPRLAQMEVRSAETGELVHVETIPRDKVGDAQSWPDWRPFDLYVTVAVDGLVAFPMSSGGVAAPSGGGTATPEGVMRFFRRYLRRDAGLELLVPAGFYRVTVGP